ncbi:polysaccharide deacetylase family protein [Kitasatospora sp. NPDC018058]|uniref:polysaccharide deacetylase family protein n=1 Tax=Kitasatospora sp. NPDC018058 TaxID=3364025 RepID=UPI0037C13384
MRRTGTARSRPSGSVPAQRLRRATLRRPRGLGQHPRLELHRRPERPQRPAVRARLVAAGAVLGGRRPGRRSGARPGGDAGLDPDQRQVVFLTVDDGWQRTPEAERFISDHHHLPITAFPLPMPAGADPDFFKRVTAVPGSSIQDHSVSHSDLSTLPLEQQQVEICDARDAIAR